VKDKSAQTEVNGDVVPVSARIRARLVESRHDFFANDNIADFIEPGELNELQNEVASKMESLLESLVIDTKNDHNTQGTARRVAKMYIQEVFGRIGQCRKAASNRGG
jgi:GTP cyclohydrolase I